MKKQILPAVLVSLIFSSCQEKPNMMRIAVAMPLTGDMGTEGQGIVRAVELAADEANASGAFNMPIEVRAFDDRADPKEAVSVANMITSDPSMVAVVGHYNSGCSIPASQVYARAGIPMISPASTNPKLTSQQEEASWTGPKCIFRVVPTDDVQGSYAAEFVRSKLKYTAMVIIHDKTPYGQGLAEQFKESFEKNGGRVISFDSIGIGERDFRALLTRVKNSKPEGIYFGGLYMEASLLIKQARELGIKVPFFSGDGSKTDELVKVGGSSVEGSYFSITGIPIDQLETAKPFVEKYKQKYPNDNIKPFDHFAYEATKIILEAVKLHGMDRAKITETIRTSRYEGILGVTEFDHKGDTKNKIITMTQVKNGEFVIVN